MSQPVLPPNPSLVTVILMIKTRSGVHHVFHYPPTPGKDKPHIKLDYENSSEEGSSQSSDGDGYISLEDERTWAERNATSTSNTDDGNIDETGSASPMKVDMDSWRRPDISRDGFLGLPVGVQHFLCPAATAHKKRFEMSIDQRVFLGWPIFSKEHGLWQRKKKSRTSKTDSNDVDAKSVSAEAARQGKASRTPVQLDEDLGETTGNDTGIEDQDTAAWDSLQAENDVQEHVEKRKGNKNKVPIHLPESLNMFHVVFVMNPPPPEYQLRVDEMYNNVVKKFTRALKWEQCRSNYVLKEAQKIMEYQAKRESTLQIIQHSSIAKAIATLYTSISTSRIAHITLTPSLTFSLQIPIPTSISVLPGPMDHQLPGLWLTTATSISQSTQSTSTQSSNLAAHFALLLLSDLPTIIADVNATVSPLTGPLIHYLRTTSPTKSFLQVSQSSGIPLPDIQFLAAHLIYWRRARAVPPLHHRDTYIVSPNADMRKVKTASVQYAKLFPALPSLPKMLSLLSSAPRSYSTFIPSKDHKEAYLQILAWLLRGGWVTQLRTFAWVRVPARLQDAVDGAGQQEGYSATEKQEENCPTATTSDQQFPGSTVVLQPRTTAATKLSPPRFFRPRSTSSLSSTMTAIPVAPTSHQGSTRYKPKLITQPTKASGITSRHLAAISAELLADEGSDAKEAWEICLKYFNGEHALEKIAAREGWKRKRVEALRAGWRERGVLLEVRGW